ELLTASVTLAAVGGTLGLLVAVWGVDALVQLSPANLPRLNGVTVDGPVLGFTAALSLLTGVLFGLAPAIQGWHVELQHVIREATPSASVAARATRLRSLLVVGEFALALVLLVGAALLVQSFWRLQRVNLGFNPSSVLTARVWLPQPNIPATGPYFSHDARVSFYARILDRIAALPGVVAAGGISNLPLGGAQGRASFVIEGQDAGAIAPANTAPRRPGYFRALGIDLVRGRTFDAHDDVRAPAAS